MHDGAQELKDDCRPGLEQVELLYNDAMRTMLNTKDCLPATVMSHGPLLCTSRWSILCRAALSPLQWKILCLSSLK